MRVVDYIHLAIKNLSRRKKSATIGIILISFAMLIFVISLSYTTCFLDAMNKAINKNIAYRTIVLVDFEESSEVMLEKALQISHVQYAVDEDEYFTMAEVIKVGEQEVEKEYLGFYGANSNVEPNIIAGRGILENEKGVCIIPEKFYPYDESEGIDDKKIIDGKNLIGKNITISYYSQDCTGEVEVINKTFEKTFTVVGVYNQEDSVNEYDECYISFEDVADIERDREKNTIYKENVIVVGGNCIYIMIDEAENVQTALSQIRELGGRALVRSVTNIDTMRIIKLVCVIVSAVLISIALINITISSVKSVIERKYEIGMQKAIGYKNKNIQGILLTENCLIGIIAYVIAIIIAIIITYLVQTKLVPETPGLIIIGIKLKFDICMLAFALSIVVPTVSSLISNIFALKKTPVSLNKER